MSVLLLVIPSLVALLAQAWLWRRTEDKINLARKRILVRMEMP